MSASVALHALTSLVGAIVAWRCFTAIIIITRRTCHAVRVAYVLLGGFSAGLVIAPWVPNNDLGAWVYLLFVAAVAFFLIVDRRRPRSASAPS